MPGTGSEPRTPQKRTFMAETRRAIRDAHGEGNRSRRPGSPEAWRQNNIARHPRKPDARRVRGQGGILALGGAALVCGRSLQKRATGNRQPATGNPCSGRLEPGQKPLGASPSLPVGAAGCRLLGLLLLPPVRVSVSVSKPV